jgi:hypothetical protein
MISMPREAGDSKAAKCFARETFCASWQLFSRVDNLTMRGVETLTRTNYAPAEFERSLVFKQYYEIAALALLLGLFPAFNLPTMQLMFVIVLIGMAMSFRQLDITSFKRLVIWRNFAFAQFYVFFLINALVYPVWDSPRMHYRAVELESWGTGLFSLLVSALWLQQKDAGRVKHALITWLPVGLTITFAIASYIYFSGIQGKRITIFNSNALVPPLWFLILTMASFVWVFEMSRFHKAWRVALFFMAGLMIVYGGARLVMLAWMVSGLALVVWMYIQASPEYRTRVLLGAGLIVVICGFGIVLTDTLAQGRLVARMAYLLQVDWTYESISARFPRLPIWSGALSVVADYPMFGVGKANERIALNQEMDWEKWFRAHQTYISFLIAGGVLALLSGLIMQSTVLAFLGSKKRAIFFPAFLGFGLVVTMNCFTDSIFQSAVNVQIFMVATLIFLRASDAD